VFNWALSFRVQGRRLLTENPWGTAAPGVKRHLERPRNRSPLRPVATYDRYLSIREAAGLVLMEARKGDPDARLIVVGMGHYGRAKTLAPCKKWMKRSYLPELIELVEQTGRRVSAVCRLQYDDVVRSRGVITALRWRPFKQEDESVVPVSDATRETLERILRERPGVGSSPMFASSRNPSKPITRWIAADGHVEAEIAAEVEHLNGGNFHPYRRKWSIERKHLPTMDVMYASGRKDERSLKESYQLPDDETVLAVVNEPKKLMSRVVVKGRRKAGGSG
jgi:integrase